MTRFATLADLTRILQLLQQFAEQACVGFRSWQPRDQERMTRVVQNWITHHYVRVAQVNHTVTGMIIAERGTDFWDPERVILQERAWYVDPDWRGHRSSAELWRAWQQDSDRFVSRDQVQAVLLSTQGSHTAFDPGRRGWRLIEQVWIKE